MLGLEISINGKKLCTAGIEKGSLSATVATVGTAQATADNSKAALLTVSGFIKTAKTYSHPWWVPPEAIPHLNAGDTVTIRVVNVDPGEVDRPSQTRRKLKRGPAQEKRKGGSLEVKETTTDKDGHFHFGGFVGLNPGMYQLQEDPLLIIFKEGYEYGRIVQAYRGNGYSDYPGSYHNPEWNGQTIALSALRGHELIWPSRRMLFYGSMTGDLNQRVKHD